MVTAPANRSVEGSFSATIRLEGVYRLYSPDTYPGGAGRYIEGLARQAADHFSGSIVSGRVTSVRVRAVQETGGYRASVLPAGEVA